MAEIQADLATCDQLAIVPWPGAARRLLADVPSLLAEVEAAHRFEVQTTRESAEVYENVTRLVDQLGELRAEVRSLRGVVQAVAELAHDADQIGNPYGFGRVLSSDLTAALAAAADAPQPAKCDHGKTERHTFGEVVSKHDAHWRPRVCPGPSPAVLPEKEQR